MYVRRRQRLVIGKWDSTSFCNLMRATHCGPSTWNCKESKVLVMVCTTGGYSPPPSDVALLVAGGYVLALTPEQGRRGMRIYAYATLRLAHVRNELCIKLRYSSHTCRDFFLFLFPLFINQLISLRRLSRYSHTHPIISSIYIHKKHIQQPFLKQTYKNHRQWLGQTTISIASGKPCSKAPSIFHTAHPVAQVLTASLIHHRPTSPNS